MIDWLRVAKSAYFYNRRVRISKATINELFLTLRRNSDSPSNSIFQHVKESSGLASWSAISYFYDRDPSFLELPPEHLRERICGFIMLVEYMNFVVIFKSGLDLPTEFKTKHLQRVSNERVEGAIASNDSTFEQIRLRNMAQSKHTLRSKTLEANDLQSVVGPSGASRYVPQSYRVRRGGEHYSATPNTGRISLRSDKSSQEELVQWCITEIDQLVIQNAAVSPFIKTFARPVDLASLPANTTPTYIAVNVAALTEELFEAEEPKHLVYRTTNGTVKLEREEVEAVLISLDQNFPIHVKRNENRVLDPRNYAKAGNIVRGKTRIALRRFEITEIEDIYIESAIGAKADGNTSKLLAQYIDRNDLFTVLFADFALAYIDGALYRDDLLVDGGGNFLRYIRPNANLINSVNEKGAFSVAHQTFDADSVFNVVINSVAHDDRVLVCDDLGDEWADFIGINDQTQPKTISFYHAKHGDLSLGASHLHVAISQAIKNLGRMTLPAETFAAKLPHWSSFYVGNNVQTAIPRLTRGDAGTLIGAAEDARLSPDTIRRVFIVTSSLSYHELETTLANIAAGTAPTPHFVQLYWLLMSFFSACTEVGAHGYIVCQD